jgi:RNA polymerase sigma-70 factor (ECF subfamily)
VSGVEVRSPEDGVLLARLRGGDESAFAQVVDRYADAMLRTAMFFTGSRPAAEEAVQDTWLAVLGGLDRFEGRSSLKTWVFRILVNRAKTQALRDRRVVPFSALEAEGGEEGPAVPPERFRPPDADRWPGHWSAPPESWAGQSEERLLAAESMALVRDAIEALPPLQRAVITLRDVQGWTAEDVCGVLQLTRANQRVLLHRAAAGCAPSSSAISRARPRRSAERGTDRQPLHQDVQSSPVGASCPAPPGTASASGGDSSVETRPAASSPAPVQQPGELQDRGRETIRACSK